MKNILKVIGVTVGSVLLVTLILTGLYIGRENKAIGSVQDGQGYFATSTTMLANGSGSVDVAFFAGNQRTIKTNPGMLGSIIISSSTVGTMVLYDATTTNHSPNYPTTTLAIIGTGNAAGTYTYDANVSQGIVASTSKDFNGVFTITWK